MVQPGSVSACALNGCVRAYDSPGTQCHVRASSDKRFPSNQNSRFRWVVHTRAGDLGMSKGLSIERL